MSILRVKEINPGEGIVSLTWKEYCIMSRLKMYSFTKRFFFDKKRHFWCGIQIEVQELFDNFMRVRGPLETIQDIVSEVEVGL